MPTENIFIAHPANSEQLKALKAFLKALKIKFEVKEANKPYDTEFVNMVNEAEQEIKKGKSKKLTSDGFDDLWK